MVSSAPQNYDKNNIICENAKYKNCLRKKKLYLDFMNKINILKLVLDLLIRKHTT